MKRICGWCRKDMGSAPGPQDMETTSICDRCVKGRVLFERRVLQLQKLFATNPPMVLVAMQCWLVVLAYCGSKWKALWWVLNQSLEIRLSWRDRKIKRAISEPTTRRG